MKKNSKRILVAILIQQYQPITVSELIKKAEENKFSLEDRDEINEIVENMKRRDLISIMFLSRKNQRVTAYGMAKPIFKNIPENAMLKNILPSMEKSPEAADFLKKLENKNENGSETETKKARELQYRNYKKVEVTLENLAPIVGGNLNKPAKLSPEVESKIHEIEQEKKDKEKKKKKDKEEEDKEDMSIAYLSRDLNGNVVFYPNQIRQYLIKLLRPFGVADSAADHLRYQNSLIEPSGFGIEQWPVIVNGKGRGVKSAESLNVGSKIHLKFLFPFKGTKIETGEQLKKAFETLAEVTGLGCYSKKYGRCKLVDFKVSEM